MYNDIAYTIIQYIALFLAILLVMPLHEFAHAFVAVKCGDNTPRAAGRYTLNPFAHFDILGLLMLMIARFGWAKPVPINPYNFKNVKWGYFWTSVAGVLANLLTAFLICPLYLAFLKYWSVDLMLFDDFFYYFLYFVYIVSINLFVFNLFPVFPLDGFRVLEVITNGKGKVVDFLRRYGYIFLMVFIVWGAIVNRIPSLPQYLDFFGSLMDILTGWLRWPIEAFWGLLI